MHGCMIVLLFLILLIKCYIDCDGPLVIILELCVTYCNSFFCNIISSDCILRTLFFYVWTCIYVNRGTPRSVIAVIREHYLVCNMANASTNLSNG